MTYDQTIAYLDTYGRLTACGVGQTIVKVSVWSSSDQTEYEAHVPITVNEAYLVSVYASAPPMFYHQSSGPALNGIYSDGTERTLNASWTTSSQYVSYSLSGGVAVMDEGSLSEGVSLVTFTGTYDGMSASPTSKYGKWIKGVRIEKTLASAGVYRYRMVVIYGDFTEKYVSFTYQTSDDGVIWSPSLNAPSSGVTFPATVPGVILRAETVDRFYDYMGNSMTWSTGY
jgi:hypothetical protein